jgi:putative membrane protein
MIDYEPHRWRDHLLQIRGSMLIEISYRVFACVLVATGIVAAHMYLRPIDVSDRPHSYVGLALGLLLVFRTNASYDRFWEGRKLWGAIVNTSRNLARASRVLLERPAGDDTPERREAARRATRDVIRWLACFPYATMNNLRGSRGLDVAGERLSAEERDAVLAAQHVPLAIAARISSTLRDAARDGLLTDYQHMQLDAFVAQLVDYLGACERIVKTPLPFAYVVHLRRALILYCFTLPLALVSMFGWATILVTLLIAYVLFGIEEIGVEIEDPFGDDDNDLPLEQISQTIEKNIIAFMPADAPAGEAATKEETSAHA